MKDYRKFKIIKKSLPIYCKDTNVQEIFCELSKERNAFSKKPLTESMITRDFTLYVSCKPKLYYRDAVCKL